MDTCRPPLSIVIDVSLWQLRQSALDCARTEYGRRRTIVENETTFSNCDVHRLLEEVEYILEYEVLLSINLGREFENQTVIHVNKCGSSAI